MEVVLASSSVESGIGCWDLHSGAEQLCYRSCASPPHGLISVSGRFLVSSQLRQTPSSSSAPIFLWSWDKPQVQVRSFPVEPVGPLVSNSDGSYFIGGGLSGHIYLWELASGKLLNKWTAHYRSVTCLALSDDESLLVSGSEDGSIRVWSLLMTFDESLKEAGGNMYLYSFSEHALPVTSIVSTRGFGNANFISSSEDRTCKIWSLSEGKLLQTITFPSTVHAIAMNPGKLKIYAGCRDGKIYVAAVNTGWDTGKCIVGYLSDHSKAITCLAFSMDGFTLLSGSDDGTVRAWNTVSGQITRLLKHSKGPVSNILVIKQPFGFTQGQGLVLKKHTQLVLPPPLDRYTDSKEGDGECRTVKMLHQHTDDIEEYRYCSASIMISQIKELQQNASTGAVVMELERLRQECNRSMQMAQQWKKLYQELKTTCVNELLDGIDFTDD
ncbi:Guanine nucleotide-binding protein subunit beta-like protein B [Apostasia shenzhenica]|uniref:Guanine nucleotide-binding protein subunit beta-like protein B n=1 Tax=Apostasia shenzhenica TaxID=1088818 RepID=A0A2I0AP43_9ASPA|nr:Guanine nucleotide-binding protein subunit beta-like protein B [Apostasia shenzhenica]